MKAATSDFGKLRTSTASMGVKKVSSAKAVIIHCPDCGYRGRENADLTCPRCGVCQGCFAEPCRCGPADAGSWE